MHGFSELIAKKSRNKQDKPEKVSLSVVTNRAKTASHLAITIGAGVLDLLSWSASITVGIRLSEDLKKLAICPAEEGEGWRLTPYGNSFVIRIAYIYMEEQGFRVVHTKSVESDYTLAGRNLVVGLSDFSGLVKE